MIENDSLRKSYLSYFQQQSRNRLRLSFELVNTFHCTCIYNERYPPQPLVPVHYRGLNMVEFRNEILLTCSGQLVTITRLIKSHRDIIYGSWIKFEIPEFYSGLSLIDRSMQPMYETYTKGIICISFFNDSRTGRSLKNVFSKQCASLFSRSFHCSLC